MSAHSATIAPSQTNSKFAKSSSSLLSLSYRIIPILSTSIADSDVILKFNNATSSEFLATSFVKGVLSEVKVTLPALISVLATWTEESNGLIIEVESLSWSATVK